MFVGAYRGWTENSYERMRIVSEYLKSLGRRFTRVAVHERGSRDGNDFNLSCFTSGRQRFPLMPMITSMFTRRAKAQELMREEDGRVSKWTTGDRVKADEGSIYPGMVTEIEKLKRLTVLRC